MNYQTILKTNINLHNKEKDDNMERNEEEEEEIDYPFQTVIPSLEEDEIKDEINNISNNIKDDDEMNSHNSQIPIQNNKKGRKGNPSWSKVKYPTNSINRQVESEYIRDHILGTTNSENEENQEEIVSDEEKWDQFLSNHIFPPSDPLSQKVLSKKIFFFFQIIAISLCL